MYLELHFDARINKPPVHYLELRKASAYGLLFPNPVIHSIMDGNYGQIDLATVVISRDAAGHSGPMSRLHLTVT